jgi:hypothetical protein
VLITRFEVGNENSTKLKFKSTETETEEARLKITTINIDERIDELTISNVDSSLNKNLSCPNLVKMSKILKVVK